MVVKGPRGTIPQTPWISLWALADLVHWVVLAGPGRRGERPHATDWPAGPLSLR